MKTNTRMPHLLMPARVPLVLYSGQLPLSAPLRRAAFHHLPLKTWCMTCFESHKAAFGIKVKIYFSIAPSSPSMGGSPLVLCAANSAKSKRRAAEINTAHPDFRSGRLQGSGTFFSVRWLRCAGRARCRILSAAGVEPSLPRVHWNPQHSLPEMFQLEGTG